MTSDPETLLTYTIHDLSPYTNYTLFIQCSLLTCVSGWGPLSGPIFVLTDEEGNNNFISFLYYIAMIQSSVMLHHHDSPWLFLTKEKKRQSHKRNNSNNWNNYQGTKAIAVIHGSGGQDLSQDWTAIYHNEVALSSLYRLESSSSTFPNFRNSEGRKNIKRNFRDE